MFLIQPLGCNIINKVELRWTSNYNRTSGGVIRSGVLVIFSSFFPSFFLVFSYAW